MSTTRPDYYHELARKGQAFPIGTHLVLHEQSDPEGTRMDGIRLGRVYVDTARRFDTPLAFPLMDLQIEKEDLLKFLGVEASRIDDFHFEEEGPTLEQIDQVRNSLDGAALTARMEVGKEALQVVAREKDLLTMGMCIGPFSLLTKLLPDPITTLYLAAQCDEDEEEYLAATHTLEIATHVILRWISHQIEAGAQAIAVCEPACNTVYLSPKQLGKDPGILEQFVLSYNRKILEMLDAHAVDLIFHDCGELMPEMISAFGTELKPRLLSLGSGVDLWEAAALVPEEVVLYGNLPSKKFYSDSEYPVETVEAEARELRRRMDATGHPYILGSECDVLCVEGCEERINRKVEALRKA